MAAPLARGRVRVSRWERESKMAKIRIVDASELSSKSLAAEHYVEMSESQPKAFLAKYAEKKLKELRKKAKGEK